MKKLSNRKLHILQLAAGGFTVKETARLLKVSGSAVEKNLNDIRIYFNAKNITNAVFKAVKSGVIIYCCFSMVNTGDMRRNVRNSRLRQEQCIISQESCLS